MGHVYKMYSVGNLVNSQLCMVTTGNRIYLGDHFEMYRNIESPCGAPRTNTGLKVNYISKTDKQTNS